MDVSDCESKNVHHARPPARWADRGRLSCAGACVAQRTQLEGDAPIIARVECEGVDCAHLKLHLVKQPRNILQERAHIH